MITSSIPGEGKTTISGNLAVAFAQLNKKVVIIEADMRRPRLMSVMGANNSMGLSNVLAGISTLDQALQRGVYVPTLDVLPAGPRPPLPSELLGSNAFDELLKHLRSVYDIVLIDTPPGLLLTDAFVIAPKVDAVLWIARAGLVSRQYLSRAAQAMLRYGMPGIGFILNGVTQEDDPYGYSYGYSHYGSYYGKDDKHDGM